MLFSFIVLIRRIIPARAGFTNACTSGTHDLRDHPRSRGVYGLHLAARWVRAGSSPLARGLHRAADHAGAVHGIIPARAGFTTVARRLRRPHRDHPRSRGVYGLRAPGHPEGPGSSPLARGLRTELLKPRVRTRIIPARAGFTTMRSAWKVLIWDHPRSRGVYTTMSSIAASVSGSSPLARGLLRCASWLSSSHRIIPARAGFTAGSSPRVGFV